MSEPLTLPRNARRTGTGLIVLKRASPVDEAYLSEHLTRRSPRELVWFDDQPQETSKDWKRATDIDVGDAALTIILGKGPSLDDWLATEEVPAGALVVGVNEAATVSVGDGEPICRVGVAQDGSVFGAVGGRVGPRWWCVPAGRISKFDDGPYDVAGLTYGGDFGPAGQGTGALAVRLAVAWGARDLLLVGFDELAGLGDRESPPYAEVLRHSLGNQNAPDDGWAMATRTLASAIAEVTERGVNTNIWTPPTPESPEATGDDLSDVSRGTPGESGDGEIAQEEQPRGADEPDSGDATGEE